MSIDLTPLTANWRFLASGLVTTLLVSALSILLGAAIGLLVGAGRTYGGRWLDRVLGFYVDTVRAVLVFLVWTYFAFPLFAGIRLTPTAAGVLALGFHLGAYVGEVIRAGLLSVRAGQMRAALALGMTRLQAIRTIILPQALIRMLPP